MRKPVTALLAFLLTSSLFAAPAYQFGDAVPLTNTRYATVDAPAALTTNGRDFFLVWASGSQGRITQLGISDSTLGRPVLLAFDPLAMVWLGDHFLAASLNQLRILNAQGSPLGPPFIVVQDGTAPRLATNGRNVMMLVWQNEAVYAYVLTTGGALASPNGQSVDGAPWQGNAAIASNGSGYAAITATNDTVRITNFDENGVIRRAQIIGGAVSRLSRPPIIASDGHAYLAIWNDIDGTVQAVAVQQDGTLSPKTIIATRPPDVASIEATSITWAGDRYAVAYGSRGPNGQFVRSDVRFFGPAGTMLGTATPLDGVSIYKSSVIASGGRLFASWGTAEGTRVRELSASNSNSVLGAWTANEQRVVEAISGRDTTLVLWNEYPGVVWRFGIRGRDGSWIERTLSDSPAKRVATDGDNYLIVDVTGDTSSTATLYDVNGTPFGSAVTIPFKVHDAAWNGRDYVIVGLRQAVFGVDVVVTRLSTSGSLSPIVVIDHTVSSAPPARLASDGDNVLVVWARVPICVSPCFDQSLAGALLDRNLNAVVPIGITITPPSQTSYDGLAVAWDGAQYAVVYHIGAGEADTGLFARRVARSGIVASGTTEITKNTYPVFDLAPAKDGTMVLWSVPNAGGLIDEAQFLARDGSVSAIKSFARHYFTGQQIVALPDFRLGYLFTRGPEADPYFGSERVMLSIGDIIPPARVPDAPKLTVKDYGDNRLRIDWTPPPQAVNGYRLEYRFGTTEWTELERWFRPGDTTMIVTINRGQPTMFSFRIRAWSDSGTSAYSAIASAPPGRRRSVR
jgi:hypothetical protein